MTYTAQCAKCAYKIDLPHADFVKMFYEQHNCEATKLQEAIARVRELHRPIQSEIGELCLVCQDLIEHGAGVNYAGYTEKYTSYPCLTIQALDGEQ